ncbi:hypothetical protein [Nocardia iowensis]|uniref:Uncharacterized protein n=1 Tax=Nocardia iowensis TaxID=204891 RepID=A0ABX8RMM6_NOCIO|nr:hypothetical protein [Nocardia iowensis]QXN90561.1 hypothetical protein KV110_35090 [Nocardia iowensis]
MLALTLREEAVANHSIRSFLLARLFAEHIQAKPDVDYDPALLFAACVCTASGSAGQRNRNAGGPTLLERAADLGRCSN